MYVLKQIPEFSAICLTHIINNIIRKSIFPKSLKTSRIIPIHKKNKDRFDLTSYRPINNLNVVEKIVESHIKEQIVDFITKNKVLDKNMHGSRKNHSVITAKIELDETINLHKDAGDKVAVLSTDLTAAYDTVDHNLLLSKLEHIGFRNESYKLIESYLSDRIFLLKFKVSTVKFTICQE